MATPGGPSLAHRRRQQRLGARAGRGGAAVHHASVQVPLPVRPSAAECGALLKALIKHLLFQRAQIPYLYDELLRAAQQQQHAAAEEAAQAAAEGRRVRRRRAPKGDRRLLKFLSKAEELLASVDAALVQLGVPRRAFLLLGASTAKPREAYEILLPQPTEEALVGAGPADAAAAAAAAAAQHGAHPEAAAQAAAAPLPPGRPRVPRQHRLCQLAVRQLVVAGAELPEGTAHTVPCKLFLLLEGGPAGADSGAGEQQQPHAAGCGGLAEELQLAAAPPPGFSIKRQFRLSMRKGLHLCVRLGPREELEQQRRLEEQVVAAAAAAAAAAAQASEGGMEGSQGDAPGPDTVHLSQLPDAAPASPEAEQVALAAAAAAAAAGAAATAAAAAAAPSTAGSVWYLCRTALKGLNSGGRDDGAAAGQSFDGL